MNDKQAFLISIGYSHTSGRYWLKAAGIHVSAVGVDANDKRAAIVEGWIPAAKVPMIMKEFDEVYSWGSKPAKWKPRVITAEIGQDGQLLDNQQLGETLPSSYTPTDRTKVNFAAFTIISIHGHVTPEFLAARLGTNPRSAASWLSKWKGLGYLDAEKGKDGHKIYKLGSRDWAELRKDTN